MMNLPQAEGRFINWMDLAELIELQGGLEVLASMMAHTEIPVDLGKVAVLVGLAADRMQCLLTPVADGEAML